MIKCKIHIVFLLFVFISVTFAGWERTYGTSEVDDVGWSVIQTNDGGYLIAAKGTYTLIKTDSLGEIIWTRSDEGRSHLFVQTPDCDYVFTGCKDNDVLLMKIDEFGDSLWLRTYEGGGNDDGASVMQTSDGGFIIAGTADYDSYTGDGDVFIIRTDSLGYTLWTKRYEGQGKVTSMLKTTDSGFVILGSRLIVEDVPEYLYPFLIKINEMGDSLWLKVYTERDWVSSSSIAQADDSGYVIVGTEGILCGYILYIDSEGNALWDTVYYDNPVVFSSIITAGEDCFYIAGTIMLFERPRGDVYLCKIDCDVNILWDNIYYQGDNPGNGHYVSRTNDDGFIITGFTGYIGSIDSDVYLIKTDSLGDIDWVKDIPTKPQKISINVSPNPFNSSCAITAPSGATIEIYDLNGRLITPYSDGKPSSFVQKLNKGDSERSEQGVYIWQPDETISSGVYLIRATKEVETITKRVILMK